MKFFVYYLIAAAVLMTGIMAATGALANGVTCELGSYGAIAAEAQGRC